MMRYDLNLLPHTTESVNRKEKGNRVGNIVDHFILSLWERFLISTYQYLLFAVTYQETYS